MSDKVQFFVDTKEIPLALCDLDYDKLQNIILETDEMVGDTVFTEGLITKLCKSLKESLAGDMVKFLQELIIEVENGGK